MMGRTGWIRVFGLALMIGGAGVAFGAPSPAPPRSGEGPAQAAASGEALRAELQGFLDEQAAAWTRGDLEAFCSSYAEDATFVSPTTGITHGRDEVLARYRRRYPTRDAMGTLSLEVLEVRAAPVALDSVGADPRSPRPLAASIVARWTLRYPDRPEATGSTLLVLHRTTAGWRIVQDASF
jgi:SnoaL-like domain